MIPHRATARRRLLGASVIAVLSVGVGAVAAGPTMPRAWIDDPLAWSTVPAVPVTVVAHATDPDGVVSVRLSVDGAPVVTAGASGDTLVTVELAWTPSGSGVFILEVVGIDSSGEESAPASAPIHVVTGEETTTTVTRPTSTTAARPASTVTTVLTTTTVVTTTTVPTTTTVASTTTTVASTTTTVASTTTTVASTTTTAGRTTTTAGR